MSDLALFMFGFGVMVTTLIGAVISGYIWFERVYQEDGATARAPARRRASRSAVRRSPSVSGAGV